MDGRVLQRVADWIIEAVAEDLDRACVVGPSEEEVRLHVARRLTECKLGLADDESARIIRQATETVFFLLQPFPAQTLPPLD